MHGCDAACTVWYLVLDAVLGIYCFAEGQGLRQMSEHAGSGALWDPSPQRSDRDTRFGAAASNIGFLVPLFLPLGVFGGNVYCDQ